MPTWSYDSYCNDMVMEYLTQYTKKNLFLNVEKEMLDYIQFEVSELDYELVLGVSMYCIRLGFIFSESYLEKLLKVIDLLLKKGKFNNWVNKEKRIIKIKNEKTIIEKVKSGRKLIFDDLIKKPKEFTDLNRDY